MKFQSFINYLHHSASTLKGNAALFLLLYCEDNIKNMYLSSRARSWQTRIQPAAFQDTHLQKYEHQSSSVSDAATY